MRFRAKGRFETEAVIEIARRVVAALQDAGVARVGAVNVYLSPMDKAGAAREITRDNEAIECLDIECGDLALQAKGELAVQYPSPARSRAMKPDARRVVAALQDAGVARVGAVNVYLSPMDKAGAAREITRDNEAIECLDIECGDLALQAKGELAVQYPSPARSRAMKPDARRRTYRSRS